MQTNGEKRGTMISASVTSSGTYHSYIRSSVQTGDTSDTNVFKIKALSDTVKVQSRITKQKIYAGRKKMGCDTFEHVHGEILQNVSYTKASKRCNNGG